MEYKLNENGDILFELLTNVTSEGSQSISVPVSEGTSGVVMVGLIALPKQDSEEAQATTKEPILGRYTIIDSTDFLFKQEFKTDSDGYVVINLDKTLSTTDAIRFYRNYSEKYMVALKIIIEIPKNDNYDYSITSDNIEVGWIKDLKFPQFKSINYSNYNDAIYLEALGSTVINFTQLKSQYKTAENNYLQIKKRYESEVISNIVDVELPINDTYEPVNFSQVVTRLLEFQTGTLVPGMSHAKSLNLETEYKRLDTLNKVINSLTRMYPKITIDDGEGIPYIKEFSTEISKSQA
jgi:hypothetical protein